MGFPLLSILWQGKGSANLSHPLLLGRGPRVPESEGSLVLSSGSRDPDMVYLLLQNRKLGDTGLAAAAAAAADSLDYCCHPMLYKGVDCWWDPIVATVVDHCHWV